MPVMVMNVSTKLLTSRVIVPPSVVQNQPTEALAMHCRAHISFDPSLSLIHLGVFPQPVAYV